MSKFYKNTGSAYADVMRQFLGLPPKEVSEKSGIHCKCCNCDNSQYSDYEDQLNLENLVNEKASRVEACDSTLGERLGLARDYSFMSNSDIASALDLSSQMVSDWVSNQKAPGNLSSLAKVLNVTLAWLQSGNYEGLSADSHLGVRVGHQASSFKEDLFSATQQMLSELDLDDWADEQVVQAFIERMVFEKPVMAQLARKAGGRWQLLEGELFFIPWIPVEAQELYQRQWSDEVEDIVEEQLSIPGQSIYMAWEMVSQRCTELGLSEDEFPRRIALFQRTEMMRKRVEKFGVDFNHIIKAAVSKYPSGDLGSK